MLLPPACVLSDRHKSSRKAKGILLPLLVEKLVILFLNPGTGELAMPLPGLLEMLRH